MSEENPFGNIPFLGDLARMLQGQGSIQWEAARQLAYSNATEGQVEPNVDPAVRFRLAELGRVAELHVQQATELDKAVSGRSIEPGECADQRDAGRRRGLDDHRARQARHFLDAVVENEIVGTRRHGANHDVGRVRVLEDESQHPRAVEGGLQHRP